MELAIILKLNDASLNHHTSAILPKYKYLHLINNDKDYCRNPKMADPVNNVIYAYSDFLIKSNNLY